MIKTIIIFFTLIFLGLFAILLAVALMLVINLVITNLPQGSLLVVGVTIASILGYLVARVNW